MSITIESEVEFDISCACGHSLDGEVKERRGSKEVIVEMCPKCAERKDDEIKELGDEIEQLYKEKEELQDQIDALQIQLTYNSLVNNFL